MNDKLILFEIDKKKYYFRKSDIKYISDDVVFFHKEAGLYQQKVKNIEYIVTEFNKN